MIQYILVCKLEASMVPLHVTHSPPMLCKIPTGCRGKVTPTVLKLKKYLAGRQQELSENNPNRRSINIHHLSLSRHTTNIHLHTLFPALEKVIEIILVKSQPSIFPYNLHFLQPRDAGTLHLQFLV